MVKSSLHPHLFILRGSDEELLLALAIAVEHAVAETGDTNAGVTAFDLWESLEGPGSIHVSLTSEWTSDRQVVLALGRLRKRKLVTRRRAIGDPGAFAWAVTQEGFQVLGKRMLFKPERPSEPR